MDALLFAHACYNSPMYLNREYKPRRRSKGIGRFWPLFLLIVVGIILYEQKPSWLLEVNRGPTPTPTLGAVDFLASAQAAISAGQFDAAREALGTVVEIDPENVDAQIQLSQLRMMFNDIPGALEAGERAVELDPDNPEALNALARALDWSGEYDDALGHVMDALAIDPENATTLAIAAEIYTDVGSWESAQSYLDEALASDPRNVLALRNQAFLYEMQGSYTAAVEEYQKAIDVAPNRFDLYIGQARQYRVGLQEYDQAIAVLEKAAEIYPSPLTLDALGDGLYNAGDHLRAVQVLRRAIELDPTYAPAQVHLGMALYARRNYEDAATAFEAGLPNLSNPRIEQIYTAGLTNVYKDPVDCTRAIYWLNLALEVDPESGPALDGLKSCSE